MRRKKNAEVEILPPEDDQSPKGRKRLVEAEHTIKYSAPVPVTVEEESEENTAEEDFDFVEEEKAKRRRKTAKDERDDFRRELDKLGVASVSRLKLSIDKYRHSDAEDSGTLAEKDFCTKDPVTKEHILNEDYLATARKFGPGRYWFTLRMDNKIVRQWERKINAAVTPSGPVIQNVNPNDPTSPQFIIQTNGDGQQVAAAPSMREIMRGQKEALKEHLEMTKLMREAYGFAPEQTQQPKTEEEVLASVLIKQPAVVENIVDSLIRKSGGKDGNDEPWWAGVLKDSITTGQLAPTVQGIVKALFPNGLFGGMSNMFAGGQNGQAPMGDSQQPVNQNPQPPEQMHQSQIDQNTGEQRVSGVLLTQSNEQATIQGAVQTVPTASAEEQALQLMIEHCRRNAPVKVACDRLIAYADLLNDQAPQYSIDGYISMFAAMPVDEALAFVKTQPNGEAVASLPHAKEWTEQLQKLIKEAGQGGEE